jgi:hypothetical protein
LNVLQVFNYKKEKVFEQRIAPSATEPFIIDYGEGKKGIGYCFRDTEQLMLFDARGEMAKGFPLSGNSEFDVLVTDSETLVVSSGGEASVVIQSIR